VQALAKILDYLPAIEKPGELLEAYHDAKERLDDVANLFRLGYLPLEQRALAEALYWRVCTGLLRALKREEDEELAQSDLAELEAKLMDLYLCDFSVFQSMLDHWAIGQPFPIMPIARLDEQPRRRGLLVDLTCDSDGKVSHYVSSYPDHRFLPLHPLRPGEPYLLGFFLMGAYEDIVGDAHNLFGRVSEAHVYADAEEPGNFWIEKVIPGTAIQDMLAQVQYFPNDLHRRMSELVRGKIQAGVIRPTQGMEILDRYMACFPQTTYCDPREVGREERT
jgi:arginine decarboxylase